MGSPLAGRRLWLTRAAHQAEPWAAALEAAGAQVWREPLMAIDGPADPAAAKRALAAAETADIVIATSSNAVRGAWRLCPDFAPAGRLYAVGAATAAALEAASGRPVERPACGFSSEGLLALDSLAEPRGRQIAILAGEGGRTALVEALAARGARVDKIALYRRRWLAIEAARLRDLVEGVDAVIVTSGEALTHLVDRVSQVGDAELVETLAECRLVAPSARVVKQTNQRLDWIHEPVVVERIGGEAIAAALAQVWKGDRQ